jgi:predicted phage gp36 major capsid-like protein
VIEAEDMPDMAADSPSVAFGDFGRGYLVVDRAGVRVLRDPFTAKPYVLFYTIFVLRRVRSAVGLCRRNRGHRPIALPILRACSKIQPR